MAPALPARPSSPRVSAHSVVATRTNSLPAAKAALSLFHRLQRVEAASAVRGSRRSAVVKEISGKSLKFQSALSSKGLTKLDRT